VFSVRFSFLNSSFLYFVANFFSISFGNVADHSLILKTDGSLWAFGDNQYGQLGDGTTIQRNFPTQILNTGVAQVAAGRSFSLILKTDGSLYAFGRNDSIVGQLGDGTNVDKLVPTMIFS
jgi:alpha-tubulin suppressor-like RCC1 family protein